MAVDTAVGDGSICALRAGLDLGADGDALVTERQLVRTKNADKAITQGAETRRRHAWTTRDSTWTAGEFIGSLRANGIEVTAYLTGRK